MNTALKRSRKFRTAQNRKITQTVQLTLASLQTPFSLSELAYIHTHYLDNVELICMSNKLLYITTWIKTRQGFKEPGATDSPSCYEHGPRLVAQENRRKTEPKEIPSCLIPCLLVVFTWKLESLVTSLPAC